MPHDLGEPCHGRADKGRADGHCSALKSWGIELQSKRIAVPKLWTVRKPLSFGWETSEQPIAYHASMIIKYPGTIARIETTKVK